MKMMNGNGFGKGIVCAWGVFFIAWAASGLASANLITVGPTGDYRTIQAGIDAAVDGGEVVAQPGRYIEHVRFNGKNIVLRSTDPENSSVVANTIIQAKAFDPDEDDDPPGSVVSFEGTETEAAMIAGFTIRGGWSDGTGGGINGQGTRAAVAHNLITSNRAYMGGGIHGCDGLILGNTIADNIAEVSGGGLAACSGVIEANTITGNAAADGGGLYGCHGVVLSNTISGNSAEHGGGLADSDGFIANCVIANNTAEFTGGGLVGCDGSVVNNTIYGNNAAVFGGGMSGCSGEIANNILWANTALEFPQLHESALPEFSCIQDWFDAHDDDEKNGDEGEGEVEDEPGEDEDGGVETDAYGNMEANPLLADPDAGDFRLVLASPVIDAGRFIAGLPEDKEGNPRGYDVIDAPRGDGSNYDIGAFEYIPPFYEVTLAIEGPGSIAPEPGGYEIEEGSVIEVLATPAEGHMLSRWAGDVDGVENPVTIQVMGDISITAVFDVIPTFTLVTDVRGEGAVVPEAGASHEFSLGTAVTLTATAAPGWQFQYWEGDVSDWRNPVVVLMDGDKTVRAVFVETPASPAPDSPFGCASLVPATPPGGGPSDAGPLALALGMLSVLAWIGHKRRSAFRIRS